MSLQEYLRVLLMQTAARPSIDDIVARSRARVEATQVRLSSEDILAARDADRR